MHERQNKALAYLKKVTGGGGGGALESIGGQDLESALQPEQAVPDELRPLVERTAAKLLANAPLDRAESFALEAIIIPDKRPVLDVKAGNVFATDHPLWRKLMAEPARARISAAIPAVGRVELPDHPSLPYGGTGFVVGNGLVMTNRHVAELFARGLGQRDLHFHAGAKAAFDLEQRIDGGSFALTVVKVAMIHPYWDMALIEVEGLPDAITPLKLAVAPPGGVFDIVAIGYPAFDQRNDPDVQKEVFRGVYNVKRVMPGQLTGRGEASSFGKIVNAGTHDSSTLGGASGSAVVDIASGAVTALHFGGVYLETNFGVPASELARDGRVIDAGVAFAGTPVRGAGPWDQFWSQTESVAVSAPVPPPPSSPPPSQSNRVSVTVPLTITVELGGAQPQARAMVGAASAPLPASDLIATEAPPADYRDRKGYLPDFLGTEVLLPSVVGAASDLLAFDYEGKSETELRYEHFSVVMSRSRRMCFLSAVNIDGALSRKSPRVGWRRDSRIPNAQQIIDECYGSPPKFSRGHMTRREDPVWGDATAAARGNADSMHVTNATPQMQAFNAPIWLALEDYALSHAREDDMKISVFTGPYFDARDPVMHGVRIPVRFWKIIAFIHDRTRKLCATGYEMSQQSVLPAADAREFVFGEFQSPQLAIATQTSIRAIEQRSGLSFHGLAAFDPRSGALESAGGDDARLDMLEQIDFGT